MNQKERRAMRLKHGQYWDKETPRGSYECISCGTTPYPCDVIKVLDAWEADLKRLFQQMDKIRWGQP